MSRSRKKTPISGFTTAESDKIYKTFEHRKERRFVNSKIGAEFEMPHAKEFGDPWLSQKDGKKYWDDPINYRK